jgi:hypothetical protein
VGSIPTASTKKLKGVIIMLIFCNKDLTGEENEWGAQNGATRRTLVLINKAKVEGRKFNAQLGKLDKGNHSFIFINQPKPDDKRVVGIFLNSSYGYSIMEEHSPDNPVIFENSSYGGPGNSESKFGIYKVGTLIRENSYKNRRGYDYYKLGNEGWEYLGEDIPLIDDEIEMI